MRFDRRSTGEAAQAAKIPAPLRRRYRPSGRVDLVRFLPLAAGVVAVALLAAWLLQLGFVGGVYVPLLFDLFAAMVVGACGLLAVSHGRCRSVLAATALGAVASLAIQPGQHLLPYLRDPSTTQPGALDFVGWLDNRLSGRDLEWTPHPQVLAAGDGDAQPTDADHQALWAATLAGVLLVPLMAAFPLAARVRRQPYCEACAEWTVRRRLGLVPAAAEPMRNALEWGNLVGIAGASVTAFHPNQPALLALLDSCPAAPCPGPAGYLSLVESAGKEPAAALAMDALFPYYRMRPRCVELDHDEAAGLQALLPDVDAGPGTEMAVPSWLLAEPMWEEELADPTRPTAALAAVDQADPPPAATTQTRKLATWLDLGPLLAGVAGTLALFGAGYLLDAMNRWPGYGLAILVTGLLPCALGLGLTLRDPHWVSNRLLLRRLARRVEARPDPLLHPGDADVLPVALVPRSVWTAPNGNEQIDHGYLAVRDGALLYEGDRWRLFAPAGAVFGLRIDPLVADQHHTFWFVVAIVGVGGTPHELPFIRVGFPLSELIVSSQKKRSAVLARRLAAALGDERVVAAALGLEKVPSPPVRLG
jgi:hypothetical protein